MAPRCQIKHDGVYETQPGSAARTRPAATLARFAAKNPASTRKKAPATAPAAINAPLPDLAHGDEQQRRSHQHRGRDGDPVGRGEIVGLAEADRQPEGDEHQQPIDGTHVNLTVAFGRSLRDVQLAAANRAVSPVVSSRRRRL